MRISWHSQARKDLQKFDKQVQEHLMKHVDELEEAPLGENTSLLTKQGLEIYRLKLKTGQLDHRVFFDLDGDKVVILGVKHRDNAYTQESIQKIKSRA
jgi:mRNA-degrading endonuclease RelE of RelBE toxin-antitoxin system